jgi:hypothetical protein
MKAVDDVGEAGHAAAGCIHMTFVCGTATAYFATLEVGRIDDSPRPPAV